jgi:serine/threonine protein kinase
MATGNRETYPQAFGRYYLTQKIALGGMAEIFRAKSVGAEGFEKIVVVKRILPHYCEDESFVTMFQDEARVAAHLNHANVVQIFDFDQVDGLYYIAMEYVEGQDLKRVLDFGAKLNRPLSIAQAVMILIEAGQGLDYAHKREVDGEPLNIIHRDISPHNMMVSYNGETKIMDFGIAKAASRSTKTRVGTVKGKCAYMSPEQARGRPLDGRSDLFALGVCLWEMLSGKRLFVGESDFETLNNVLKAEVPSLTEMNAEVPEDLDRIVQKALAKERDDRHKDVLEFVSDLRRWFYSTVPDPSAISVRDYLLALFQEEINKLKVDVAAEAAALNELRTNSGVRRPNTSSSNVALQAADDATIALDTSNGLSPPQDSDATVALDTSAASLLTERSMATMTSHRLTSPPKSKTGLFIGIGALVVAAFAIGGFVAMQPTAAPVVAAVPVAGSAVADEPVVKRIKVKIVAKGAREIQVNGQTEATSDHVEIEVDEGADLKILAIAADDTKELLRVTAKNDGQEIVLELPEKKVAPKPVAVAPAPVVILQVEPFEATVKVRGSAVVLVGGNYKVPDLKLGDSFIVEATASGYNDFSETFMVKNAIETLDVKLDKIRVVREVAKLVAKGNVTISAKPWANVILRGKNLGLTPRSVELPAGRHTFTLTKGSISKTLNVTVSPSKTSSYSLDMM